MPLTDANGKRMAGGLQVSQERYGYRVSPFVKFSTTPVLPKGPTGWDAWGVRDFSVLIDEQGYPIVQPDGIWAYYFGRPTVSGTIQLGLAKSADGGFTWTKYSGNPVLTPSGAGGSWFQIAVAQAGVLQRASDGLYLMIVQGTDGGGNDSLGVCTSSDGLSWSDGGQKLTLADFTDGGTAITQLGVPCVIKQSSGTYLVIFEALTSGITNGWRLYGATSTTFTGTWTPMNSGHPLFANTGSGFESVGVANPHFIEAAPGNFLLAYNGITTDLLWRIGFATSTNLTTWARYSGNPVLAASPGSWDNLQTETSALIKGHNDQLRLFYQGYTSVDNSMQIGLATAAQSGGGAWLDG